MREQSYDVHHIYMQGWPKSVKSSAIATLKEDRLIS